MKSRFASLFIFGFSILIAFSALELGIGSLSSPGPGFIPFFAAILLLGFCISLFFSSFKKRAVSAQVLKSNTRYGKMAFIVAILLGYSLLLNVLGFVLITIMLMFVLFLMDSRKTFASVVSAIVGASVTTLCVYVLFKLLLSVRFPIGILNF